MTTFNIYLYRQLKGSKLTSIACDLSGTLSVSTSCISLLVWDTPATSHVIVLVPDFARAHSIWNVGLMVVPLKWQLNTEKLVKEMSTYSPDLKLRARVGSEEHGLRSHTIAAIPLLGSTGHTSIIYELSSGGSADIGADLAIALNNTRPTPVTGDLNQRLWSLVTHPYIPGMWRQEQRQLSNMSSLWQLTAQSYPCYAHNIMQRGDNTYQTFSLSVKLCSIIVL